MIRKEYNPIEKYKKNKLVQSNFFIDPKDKEKLEEIAKKNDIIYSELIRIILKDYLDKQKESET